jgi:hypothetical protein
MTSVRFFPYKPAKRGKKDNKGLRNLAPGIPARHGQVKNGNFYILLFPEYIGGTINLMRVFSRLSDMLYTQNLAGPWPIRSDECPFANLVQLAITSSHIHGYPLAFIQMLSLP